MKILHLSAQKPDSTGSGVYLAETVKALALAGHSQAVIAGIAPEDAPSFPEGVLFRPVRFETEDLPFPVVGMSNVMPYRATRYCDLTPEMTKQFKMAFERAIDDVLGRFEPDLVICHHLYLLASVLAHRVERLRQGESRLVACAVCGLSHSTDMRQFIQIPLEREFIREGVNMLDCIYALHDAQACEIADVYGVDPGKIRVVGTGYDANEFHILDDEGGRDANQIVYVGKICRKKGVESLLRAFGKLNERMPQTRLVLVGGYSDQDEYDELVQIAEAGNMPVSFLGRISQDELVRAYNDAAVFALPSFYEGLPLVIVEALACGCKVVSTDLPGIRPWIEANVEGETIIFVKPPRMHDVDAPVEEDLPAFEANLEDALEQALLVESAPCDTSRASWSALAARLL